MRISDWSSDVCSSDLGRAEGLPEKTLEAAAMDRLKSHGWPGNVRELENLVRRLAVLYSEDAIGVEVIDAELADGQPQAAAQRSEERRVGKACVSTGRSRWAPNP